MRADRIRSALEEDSIVLVAGFQGVSTDSRDVTTLGRGGSDTTAVALAAALGGEVCEIYTDVEGVFTADPRIVPKARKLPVVSYEEMLEMASSGAKVLQLRAVEYARNHDVRIHCRSSASEAPGTLVVSEQETMERPLVTAVTHSTDEARVTLTGVPDEPGVAGRIFGALADANINVDMIIQNEPVSHDGGADLSFTVEAEDLEKAVEVIRIEDSEIGIETDEAMGKVSIVGAGMRSHPGVAAQVFRVLGENEINIEMISTSPIKISCVIRADRVPDAVKALHSSFELGEGAIQEEDPTGAEHHPTVHHSGGALHLSRGRGGSPYSLGMAANGEYRVGIVGATGAVGSTLLEVLAERKFPAAEVRPLASARSAGSKVDFAGGQLEVQELTDETIQGLDLILSSAGGKVSSEWAPKWIEAGAVVVDNTSYWRMHEDVPLVVAGVNDDAVADHNGLVANPNCTTMELMVALKPILDAAGIERLIVSTYQSVSGPAAWRSRSCASRPRPCWRASRWRRTSIRTRSPSTWSRRWRTSRTATTTRPRSAS